MNILIAPDKFKGSLTAQQVCDAVEEGIKKYSSKLKITKLPLADGGEGSLVALENTLNFERIYLTVANPIFKNINTFYGLLNTTAYIEMASASGLQLLSKAEQNPMYTTSLGTGQMIFDALQKGANKIYLFVGGSASNDAGMGIASALGYEFKDEQNNLLEPIGKNLSKISTIEKSEKISFNNFEIIVLTDVKNKLFGKNGAAHLFAPQKGATEEEVIQLDSGLRNFTKIVKQTFKISVQNMEGTGAGGGVVASLLFIDNTKVESGIETILTLLHFEEHIKQADLVITGEGLLDKQTLEGKVVKGVFNKCKKHNKQLAIVCGCSSLTKTELKEFSGAIIKPIKTKNISKEASMQKAYSLLVKRSEELMKELRM